jgi:type II secretory pathway pseudopilin PulG
MVEMIVAVGLFAIVMTVSIGALLSLVEANRRAQALQSVVNNLNVAVDGMVRSIREGSGYYCGGVASSGNPTEDCTENGEELFSFTPFHASGENPDPWLYWFDLDENGVGRLYKSEDGTQAGGLPVTSPEVSIESVIFYVFGSTRGGGDLFQPKVTVVIKGTAGRKITSRSTFHVQATAVQRVLDL